MTKEIKRNSGCLGNTPVPSVSAWLIHLSEKMRLSGFIISFAENHAAYHDIRPGDALLIVQEGSNGLDIVGFARVYRVRCALDETTILFDGMLPVEPSRSMSDFGIQPPTATVSRLEWPLFEAALKSTCGIEFDAFPSLDGHSPQEQAYIRDLLQYALFDDLLGPADGPEEEIIGMSVRDRYLVGRLAPKDVTPEDLLTLDEEAGADITLQANPDRADRSNSTAAGPDDIDEEKDPVGDDSEKSRSLVPSSFGFTFCVDASAKVIELRTNWGRYERITSEKINEKTGKTIPQLETISRRWDDSHFPRPSNHRADFAG